MARITTQLKDILSKRIEVFTRRDVYNATAQQHINEAVNEAVDALALHKGAYLIIDDFKITIVYRTYTSEHFLY